MHLATLQDHPELRAAARVLRALEERGLREPAIASGFIRSFLAGTRRSDIDIAYVGSVHFLDAQWHLREVLAELDMDPSQWDIAGIWNAQTAYGLEHTEASFLAYHICSIDTVYLDARGILHDPTGHGAEDGPKGILRLNERTNPHLPHSPAQLTYFYIEACRRLALFGWTPTDRSAQIIRKGISSWQRLSGEQQRRAKDKLLKKFDPANLEPIRRVYEHYGWGCMFSG